MEDSDLTNIEAVKAALAAAYAHLDAVTAFADARKARTDADKTHDDTIKALDDTANAYSDVTKALADARKARADAEKTRADAKKALADAEKTRAHDLNARQSLHAHIYHLYAHCFQTLRIRQKGPETTAPGSTSVLGRTCPMKLLPWNDFPELHQKKFTDLSNAFGDELLLPPLSDTYALQRTAQEWSHDSENESSRFCSMLIELHVATIASTWRQIVSEEAEEVEFCPNTAYIKESCEQLQEYKMKDSDDENSGVTCLDISSMRADISEPATVVSAFPSRGRRPSQDISNAGRNLKWPANSPPDSDGTRPIKAQSPERSIKPDGTFVKITNKPPKVKNLLVIEHKPANVFTPDLLRSAFRNIVDSGSRIFTESTDPRPSPSASGNTEKKNQKHPAGSKLVAKALVQTYHYMVTLGLSYGSISTGQATILLHINYKEPSELYFRLCVHQKDVGDIPCRGSEDPLAQDSQISSALENGIKNTPYAMLMTMIQLAFDHTNLSVQEIASIQNRLPRFHGSKKPPSDPSSSSGKGNGSEDTGSSSLRNPYPQLPPPDGRSSSQREQDPFKKHTAHMECPPDSWRIGCRGHAPVPKNKGGNSRDDGRSTKRVRSET
ncbi:phosphotransferase-like protein [Ceratocystis lukuohia]|uniref:Phosphotransferase-like protein n=1 Tax=Ceratocystis lukuohia TaxID=2019550 RepID=A0ABR4MAB7_9PEZI